MVLPRGFEPLPRSNLELTVYKTAVLPLNYRSKLGANGWTQTSYDGVMSAATIHFVLAGKLAGDRRFERRPAAFGVLPDPQIVSRKMEPSSELKSESDTFVACRFFQLSYEGKKLFNPFL